MSRRPPSGRRNAVVLAGSSVALGLLLLYPTSLDPDGQQRAGRGRGGAGPASAGIVAASDQGTATTGRHTGAGTSGRTGRMRPAATITVDGASVSTPYGRIQVQIVVRRHRIVSATAIDFPQANGHDREVSAYALPLLEHEALSAQGAAVDMVSGATYTSDGYRRSLQDALDSAGLRQGLGHRAPEVR